MSKKKSYFSAYDPETDECVACGTSPTLAHNFCVPCYRKVRNKKLLKENDLDVIKEQLESGKKKKRFKEYDPKEDKCVVCGDSPTYAKNYCHKCYARVRRYGEFESTDLNQVINKVFPERLSPDFEKKQAVIKSVILPKRSKPSKPGQYWPDFGDDGDPYVFRSDE